LTFGRLDIVKVTPRHVLGSCVYKGCVQFAKNFFKSSVDTRRYASYNADMEELTEPAAGVENEPVLDAEVVDPALAVDLTSPTAHSLAELLAHGIPLLEACQQMGIEPAQAQPYVIQKDFAKLLQQYAPPEKEIRAKFDAMAAPALQTLQTLMTSDQTAAKTRASIAKDLLDRAGYAPVKKVAVVSFQVPQEKRGLMADTAAEVFAELREDEDESEGQGTGV